MAQSISLMGATYNDVPAVLLPKSTSGMAQFDDTTDADAVASDILSGKTAYVNGVKLTGTGSGGSSVTVEPLSVTNNGTYTAPSGTAYSPVTVNVSGGGGGVTLLGTQIVGQIQTSSTSEIDTGITITVKGVYAYDTLFFVSSVDTRINSRHLGTVGQAILYSTSGAFEDKTSVTGVSQALNYKIDGNGVVTSRSSTATYGVYVKNLTLSAGSEGDNGQIVGNICQRYNSTQTGTINGTYTVRVYGVKLYDLMGG